MNLKVIFLLAIFVTVASGGSEVERKSEVEVRDTVDLTGRWKENRSKRVGLSEYLYAVGKVHDYNVLRNRIFYYVHVS